MDTDLYPGINSLNLKPKNSRKKRRPFRFLTFVFFISAFIISPYTLHPCFAQTTIAHLPSQTQTFKSSKIKINSYGTREQTSTITPNIISINLNDSIIIVQPEHPGINEFLGHQNQFEISKSIGTGIITRVYFTSSEYVFTIDSKMRVIVVSKRDISPKIHSVWFEEISSSN